MCLCLIYITNTICTMIILSHVSAGCAFSIWECLRSEEFTNIYHFCYILQLNLMFYFIKVAFLICILQCATSSKTLYLSHYIKKKNTTCSLWRTNQFSNRYIQSVGPSPKVNTLQILKSLFGLRCPSCWV